MTTDVSATMLLKYIVQAEMITVTTYAPAVSATFIQNVARSLTLFLYM